MTYTIQASVSANYAFMPKLWDAFSAGLGDKEVETMDPNYKMVVQGRTRNRFTLYTPQRIPARYNPTIQMNTPTTMQNTLNRLQQFYYHHKAWIDPAITIGA